jgi:hypothetical protein
MKHGLYLLILFGYVRLMPGAFAQSTITPLLPDPVMSHVDRALDALVMTRADAGFSKDHGEPKWTLAWITNTLADPWLLPGYAEQIQGAVEADTAEALWKLSGDMLELIPSETQAAVGPSVDLNDAIDRFMDEVAVVHAQLEQVFSVISPSNRVALAASLLVSIFETEDNVTNRLAMANAGVPRAAQKHIEADARLLDGTAVSLEWLARVELIDLSAVHRAAHRFYAAVNTLAESASQFKEWPFKQTWSETPYGLLVVGSRERDVFDRPALLILDPGGDDHYRNNAGAANGLYGHLLAAVIDLDGHDVYHSEELIGCGAALWGVSVVIDAKGDDVVDAHYLGSGAALYGAAWYEDQQGNDRYRAHAVGQGAAMVGFGFHCDTSGDDTYDVGFYGQGFSGVKGWGLLVDRAGNDRYFAGNRNRDHERNDNRYLSLAQGFSIGMRPHAGGGVAALVDLEGNDVYTSDIYGQGVSYYYAAGFLLDAAGNDRYTMYQYGQGCGIHLSLGLLADGDGEDFYTGYILAQGAAHDYAVGMLFDHAGNDTYTADHHAQGRALNNAFAVLVDRAGDDAYFGRQRDLTQGIGNTGGFRDYGSLALLLDLDGKDIYSGGFSNRMITLRPLFGAVYDTEVDGNE